MKTQFARRTASSLTLAAALAAVLVSAMLVPLAGPVHAGTQSNKNLWRNLGIGGAAVGVYGLAHHNTTLGLLGLAGGAYSAERYEQERHSQSLASHRRSVYYHRQSYYHETVGNYNSGDRRYYLYNGQQYYEDLRTGARRRVG